MKLTKVQAWIAQVVFSEVNVLFISKKKYIHTVTLSRLQYFYQFEFFIFYHVQETLFFVVNSSLFHVIEHASN